MSAQKHALPQVKYIIGFLVSMAMLLSVSSYPGAEVTIDKVEFAGWSNCYKMSNGTIDLIAVADVGPRILWFGFTGGENEFHVSDSTKGKTGGLSWVAYGGHRLWVAPESRLRTYFPDNFPVSVDTRNNILHLTAPVESRPDVDGSTGVQKEMVVAMDDTGSSVTVTHRITNQNVWDIELALWALTFMKAGGKLIVPNPSYGPHPENLLPVRTISVWKYTEMGDSQFDWGNRYIVLSQDRTRTRPNKFGVANIEGWAAYQNGDRLFVKYHEHIDGATYPDLGCSLEAFTNNEIVEFETLGPMIELAPGETGVHVERWKLFDGVGETDDEESINREVKARVLGAE